VILYAVYQMGVRSGYYRWRSQVWQRELSRSEQWFKIASSPTGISQPIITLPESEVIKELIGPEGLSKLIEEADEIASNRIRLFGGKPVPLILSVPKNIRHWTGHRKGRDAIDGLGHVSDIKFIWEPARFGWAFTLGRAYYLTGNESYAESFWHNFEFFQMSNPVDLGPNWASAQEAALRILAFVFSAQIFNTSSSSTDERKSHLLKAIADHAYRIPPTLIYARALNNNHLLSEAAGLISASMILPDHPDSRKWGEMGWEWFNQGLETQITHDGAYIQHSTNYHRLMLQLVLWVLHIHHTAGREKSARDFPGLSQAAMDKSRQAVLWLRELCDPDSGRVPNLGPNDGAYILPLTVLSFEDYRPVLQAASRELLGKAWLEPGPWDEMIFWLKSGEPGAGTIQKKTASSPSITTLRKDDSWVYLRAAQFSSRPGHCDQLHLDLWWRGLNVAQDAGTYLYNGEPPWENALTTTAVHNTVMVDNREQMTRAGKFLTLDWAQAGIGKREESGDGSWERIIAWHNGFDRSGVIHKRAVTAYSDGRWVVDDYIEPSPDGVEGRVHEIRLHWLLPDWPFKTIKEGTGLQIQSPFGWVTLRLNSDKGRTGIAQEFEVNLIRSGVLLDGEGEVQPYYGWVSPTYGVKVPALSFSSTVRGKIPLRISSEWIFPEITE